MPDLKLLVEKKFLALQDKNSDADFKDNEKFVQYKQQLRELKKQCKSAAWPGPLATRALTSERSCSTGSGVLLLCLLHPLLSALSCCSFVFV